jgi:hypothetical protein
VPKQSQRTEQLKGRAAVFAGPSGPVAPNDRRWCRFPPASAGDIDIAVANGFSRIVLADTLFLDASPTHRELMRALSAGVELFGVASAGALRAVELGHLGMIGCGVVYTLYKRGILKDDGELASPLYGSEYTSISPPLIQLRYYLGYLLEYGLDSRKIKEMFAIIAGQHFMIRDLNTLRQLFYRCLGEQREALLDVDDPIFAIKSIDLDIALRHISDPDSKSMLAPRREINIDWLRAGVRLRA